MSAIRLVAGRDVAPVAPTRPPLISSEARRREAEGKPFYERAHLKPQQIPATFRAMTAYPRRVVRRSAWAILPSLAGASALLVIAAVVLLGLAAIGVRS